MRTIRSLFKQHLQAETSINTARAIRDDGTGKQRADAGQGSAGDARFGSNTVSCMQTSQERLQTLNAADFGDLLLHCSSSSRKRTFSRITQELFRYILVDECQDTGIAQYLWLIAGEQEYLLRRRRQSVDLRLAGAEIGNILSSRRTFLVRRSFASNEAVVRPQIRRRLNSCRQQ